MKWSWTSANKSEQISSTRVQTMTEDMVKTRKAACRCQLPRRTVCQPQESGQALRQPLRSRQKTSGGSHQLNATTSTTAVSSTISHPQARPHPQESADSIDPAGPSARRAAMPAQLDCMVKRLLGRVPPRTSQGPCSTPHRIVAVYASLTGRPTAGETDAKQVKALALGACGRTRRKPDAGLSGAGRPCART